MWKSGKVTSFASSSRLATNSDSATSFSGSGKLAGGCLLATLLIFPAVAEFRQNGMGMQNGMSGMQNNPMHPPTAPNPPTDRMKQGQTAGTGVKPLQGGTNTQPNNELHPKTTVETKERTLRETRSHSTEAAASTAKGKKDRTGTREAEQGKTETGRTDSNKTKTGRMETGKTETGKTETGRTKGGETQTGKTETGKTEAGEMQTSKTEAGKTEAGNNGQPNIGMGQQAGAGVQTQPATLPQFPVFQQQGQASERVNQSTNLNITATKFGTIKMTEPTQPNAQSGQTSFVNSTSVSGLFQMQQNLAQQMMGLPLSVTRPSQQQQVSPQQVSSQQMQNGITRGVGQMFNQIGSVQQQLNNLAAQSSAQGPTRQQQVSPQQVSSQQMNGLTQSGGITQGVSQILFNQIGSAQQQLNNLAAQSSAQASTRQQQISPQQASSQQMNGLTQGGGITQGVSQMMFNQIGSVQQQLNNLAAQSSAQGPTRQQQVSPQQASSQQMNGLTQGGGITQGVSQILFNQIGSAQQQLNNLAAQSSMQAPTRQQQTVNQIATFNKSPLRLDTSLVEISSAKSVLSQGQIGKQSPMANVANQLPGDFVQQVIDKQGQQIQGQQQQIQGQQQQIQQQQKVITARTGEVAAVGNEVKAQKQTIADQQKEIAAQQAEIQKLEAQQKSETCAGPLCAGINIKLP
jgi:hypothetical protein